MGTMRGIRRTPCPVDSPFANGIIWEWTGDLNWIPYDVQTACNLEKALNLNHPILDLSSTVLGIPNIVDFQKMLQINKHTGFKRQINRRSDTTFQYPKVTVKSEASPSGSGSPAKASHVKTRASRKATSGKSGSQKTMNMLQVSANSGANDSEDGGKESNVNKKMRVMRCEHPLLQLFSASVLKPPDEECVICFEKLSDESGFSQATGAGSSRPNVKQLSKCKHCFHTECLLELLKSKSGGLQCPTCKTMHGIKQGTQPDNGTMDVCTSNHSLPGFPGCGMITIVYNFTPGIQGPEHPNPGKRYYVSGFPRTCYLPNSDKGNKVLRLLRKAWDRRLVFTVATSVTMGLENAVVWNEIHHKTEAFSNSTGHGYPDPNYLDNVLSELAAQGVEDDDNSS